MVVNKKDDQADENLYLTTDDNFIFGNEDAAISHVLENYKENYFDIEKRKISAPARSFICLHKCEIPGKVLCRLNYHKYQEILLEHHNRFLPNMSFEKFKSRS
jgi:hypothetical protein